MEENWDFSGFFSDFRDESLFLSQNWGLYVNLWGMGDIGKKNASKNVEK
jgi:hypothetical protein